MPSGNALSHILRASGKACLYASSPRSGAREHRGNVSTMLTHRRNYTLVRRSSAAMSVQSIAESQHRQRESRAQGEFYFAAGNVQA